MPSVATFPAPSPFERIVDVRVWPHGFTAQQTDTAAGPAGSAIVRPNIESAAWHSAAGQKWGGNIVWTGSTVKHTIAYNGPRGRYFGTLTAGSFVAFATWFSHNGANVAGPSGRVLGACVKVYDSLPTHQTYAGTGTGTLTMQDPSTTVAALTGDYTVRCITAGATPRFLVAGPDAQPVGVAEAGPFAGAAVLFDGVLRFTLQSGAVAFVVGDQWTVTVEEAEQFVAIVTPGIDATPQTETVWRRGVSLSPASPWRQIASIAPVSGQVGGSIQPWFFNASATQAVTCRGLGADADTASPTYGCTLGTVARTLALPAGTVSDSVETSSPRMATGVYSITAADATNVSALTDVMTSASTGPVRQLMALDFDGDALQRIEIEFDGYKDGTSSMVEYPGQTGFEDTQGDSDVNTTFSAWADVMLPTGRLRVFDLAGSASQTRHWPPHTSPSVFAANVTEAITVRALRDVADARGARTAYTEYTGTETATDLLDGNGSYAGSGIVMRHQVAGSLAAEATGSTAPGTVNLFPSSAEFMSLIYLPGYPELTYTSPQVVFTHSVLCMGVGALGKDWTVVQRLTRRSMSGDACLVATGGLPTANSTTGKGLQTSVEDTRGNWLLAAEIAAPAISLWPGSFPGSGTYTLKTGGPDALTPAQVHTLTGHAGADLWNIGAF